MKYNGHILIDGSVSNNFPIDVARNMGADFVIAIDAALNFDENAKVNNVIDLVIRSAQITVRHLDEHLRKQADYVVKPDIGTVHWSEFNRVDELIKRGEEAAEEAIPEIKKHLKKRIRLI